MKSKTKELEQPEMLHIDIGNQPISTWLKNNKYIVFSELIRYIETIILSDLDTINAILITNFSENVVLVVRKEEIDLSLELAMNYFLNIEEYEICAKIRDLQILIEKSKKDEKRNTEMPVRYKRKSKIN